MTPWNGSCSLHRQTKCATLGTGPAARTRSLCRKSGHCWTRPLRATRAVLRHCRWTPAPGWIGSMSFRESFELPLTALTTAMLFLGAPAGTNGESRVSNLEAVITCPACGHTNAETMPTNACQFFYECKGCGTLLKPKARDCCVFCSYGSVPCPPVQARSN